MKILVASDTHGRSEPLLEVAAGLSGIHVCVFLGDGSRDADLLQSQFPSLALYRVRGNCDFGSYDPDEALTVLGGLLVYYTHGHQLGVKQGVDALWQHAHSRGADIALFGHTHAPYYEFRNGVHLFNPGTLGQPRGGEMTYGMITIENGKPSFETLAYPKR